MSMNSVCRRKVRHRSRACAEKALRATLAAGPVCLPLVPLTVYQCPYCKLWHVGHEMPRAVIQESTKQVKI